MWDWVSPSIVSNLALVLVVFILDLATPLGTPIWVLYILAFFFIPSSIPRQYPLALAGLCTILLLVGYLLSSEGAAEPLSQRGLVIIALWVYGMFLSRRGPGDEEPEN